MLEINIEKSVIAEVMKVLSIRYVMAAIFSAVFFFVLPFESEIKRALAVVAFAPVSIIGSTFTEKAGGSAIQSSLAVSISILCSVIIMTIMVIGLGVGAA
jgi:predicted permease